MFLPIAWKSGITRSTASVSPPTMIESVALRAPTSPPDTGASIGGCPFGLRRLVNLAREAGLGRRHVDDDAAFPDRVEDSALLLIDLADVARQSDDRKDDVRPLGDTAGVSAQIAPLSSRLCARDFVRL